MITLSKLDPRAPLVLDTRELGRRPGSQREVSRSVPAPADLGIEVLAVPEGSPVEFDLRLEAVMEGVLVTGTARAALEGECARCLGPIHDEIEVELQELYVYDDRDHDPDEDDEVSTLQDDLLDLEPLLRDAVVLALPFQPLCEDDCPGLCVECGARLADDPGHAHEAAIDPRWAGADRARARRTDHRTRTEPGPTIGGENSGSPEAEDVAEQHASPSLAVEGRRAVPGDLRQPGLRCQAPAAPCLRRRAASTAPGPTAARCSEPRRPGR